MQVAANPWFFTNADQATTVAISSIVNNGASLLVTTGAAHGFVNYQPVSIQGTTEYQGPYKVLSIPSATTFLVQNDPSDFTSANLGAGGNVLSMAYIGGNVRAEQMYWQPNIAADILLITDGFGNTVWNPKTTQSATGGSFGPYSYGKVFWFQNGLVINTLPASNTLQITIN